MNADELHALIGRRVVDSDGRHVGPIVGITHHSDGATSALVSCWSGMRRSGIFVSLAGAVVIDGTVRLGQRDPQLGPLLSGG